METLLRVCNISWDQISCLYIAGGFGSYLDLESACAVGLIPHGMRDKTRVMGNAALIGAAMILRRSEFAEKSDALAQTAKAVHLDSNPKFMDEYINHMMFDESE